MRISNVTVFCKKLTCPASELLLSYCEEDIAISSRERIDSHLVTCDFCHAEVQFLTQHPALAGEHCEYGEMPVHLRLLAESILSRDKPGQIFFPISSLIREPVEMSDV